MHVLHLDAGTEMRGGQWQVLALLQGLTTGGLTAQGLTTRGSTEQSLPGKHTLLTAAEGPLMRAAKDRGVTVEPLNMLSIAALSREADLTHAHDARSHTWAASLAGCPLVVSRRVAFPVGKSWISRWKYSRASRYLAVSEHVKRTLLEAEVPETKISVVYDGVDLPSTLSSGGRILSAATLDPMKGRDLLAEAARIANVHVDYSENLQQDLLTASVFVYITRSEGLGSAALLAMASGVPVVASRVGGLPEIVEDGVNGVLTDNDPYAIARAIRRALDMHSELASNARKCVEQRFSTTHMVQRTHEAYERVLA